MTNWTAMPSVFPSGMAGIQAKLKVPMVMTVSVLIHKMFRNVQIIMETWNSNLKSLSRLELIQRLLASESLSLGPIHSGKNCNLLTHIKIHLK